MRSIWVLGLAALVVVAATPSAGGTGTTAPGEGDGVGARKAGKVVRVEREPATVVEVPAGTFQQGMAPQDVDDLEATCRWLLGDKGTSSGLCPEYRVMNELMLTRDVHVGVFAIDRDEVTVERYRACVIDGACPMDPLLAGDERYLADDLPQVNITWDEATTYCTWRGGRLPTEAEWEWAARGDDDRRWPWGLGCRPELETGNLPDDMPPCTLDRVDDWNHGALPSEAMVAIEDVHPVAFPIEFGVPDASDGHEYASPPGAYPWDEGPFGTRDQAGNVAEWVVDTFTFDGYLELESIDPVRDPDSGSALPRVVRGGSWRTPRPFGQTFARIPVNSFITGAQRHPDIGFRCAYDR